MVLAKKLFHLVPSVACNPNLPRVYVDIPVLENPGACTGTHD
jgi:hypothetical protein